MVTAKVFLAGVGGAPNPVTEPTLDDDDGRRWHSDDGTMYRRTDNPADVHTPGELHNRFDLTSR